MQSENNLLLVDSTILPKVFLKVVEAKKLLGDGTCRTIGSAVAAVGISRSAFYKYKDSVFPFVEMGSDRIYTLFFIVSDKQGVLSAILGTLADSGANILTINQNIPVNNTANITISLNFDGDIRSVLEQLRTLSGIKKVDIISKA